jgi:hypothetical protein
MATVENANGAKFVMLTKAEACSIIGSLGAMLADEALEGSHGGSCPYISVYDIVSNINSRMFFIVDPHFCDVTSEILEAGKSIIVLPRNEAANIIGNLAKQMVKWGGDTVSVSVQDRGKVLYRLVLGVR